MLHEGGIIRYFNETNGRWPNATVQRFYEVPFDPATSTWAFPGKQIATISGRSDELLARFTMTGGFYPITTAGDLVVFDSSTGTNSS